MMWGSSASHMAERLTKRGASVTRADVSRTLVCKTIVCVCVAGVLAYLFLAHAHRPDFSDFKVYWIAGEKAALHQTVYDVQGHYQFKYSPFIALLWAIPAALLPGTRYHWALLHYAACGAGFALIWYLLARSLAPERAAWLWLMLLFVFGVGLRDELKLGQANLWPFVLVLPAWFTGPRRRNASQIDWTGLAIGAAWACAIQWKLYALVLAPVWLLRGRPQIWLGALAFTLLSLLGAMAAFHGAQFALTEDLRWLRSLTASSEELLVSKYNVSALGTLGRWTAQPGAPPSVWSYAVWLLLAAAWGLELLWAEREAKRRAAPFLRFWSASWAWAGIVVLNPLVWPYWLLLCLPLFLAYVAEATRGGFRHADPIFYAVSLIFIAANFGQNHPIAHAGAALGAVLLLLFDAQRRARTRTAQQLDQLTSLPLTFPSRQR
jgi:hypothetical protein